MKKNRKNEGVQNFWCGFFFVANISRAFTNHHQYFVNVKQSSRAALGNCNVKLNVVNEQRKLGLGLVLCMCVVCVDVLENECVRKVCEYAVC